MDRKIPNIKVHIIITMSSTIWVTVLVAKMAIKTTNRGSYLEVTFEANRHCFPYFRCQVCLHFNNTRC